MPRDMPELSAKRNRRLQSSSMVWENVATRVERSPTTLRASRIAGTVTSATKSFLVLQSSSDTSPTLWSTIQARGNLYYVTRRLLWLTTLLILRKYPCQYCGSLHTQKSNLRIHERIQSVCSLCLEARATHIHQQS